jgi:hypothetical protein
MFPIRGAFGMPTVDPDVQPSAAAAEARAVFAHLDFSQHPEPTALDQVLHELLAPDLQLGASAWPCCRCRPALARCDRLRTQWREREKRNAAPTAAVLDAQSTRSSPQGGEHGFDAGKKIKGRKRNLVVDTLGLLLAVTVTAASVQDRDAAHAVVGAAKEKYPSMQTLFVDGGYAGKCA